MTAQQLTDQIKSKKSFLCVGLDTDITKIPPHLLNTPDPIFEFNKEIINNTAQYTIAYKPNLAFYEVMGEKGWLSLKKTVKHIRTNYPEILIIADAKRGDIGNTSTIYAKTFFESFDFDAITLSPYMGEDTIKPFLNYTNKWVVILALTSNQSAKDFQLIQSKEGKYLFESVIQKSMLWGTYDNTMYVVGATKAEMLQNIRKIIPNHFLLIPGVGEQGGNLSEVARYGLNNSCGLIVNASRYIIYSDSSIDFAKVAGEKAYYLQQEMSKLLKEKCIV